MSETVELVAVNVQRWGGFYPGGDGSGAERFAELTEMLASTGPFLAAVAKGLLADAGFELQREDLLNG